MLVKSYTKINLYLKINKKVNSGYHSILSVMQQINLYDNISFKKIKENKIIIRSNIKEIENENNLAYKAALLLKNKYKISQGIEIRINKKIPIGAGLAGGSSNAAATLIAFNKIFNLKLKKNDLIKLGKKIGADVPFHIIGGTCLIEGIGEKVKKLKLLKNINIVLINPGIEISTKWAYDHYDKFVKNNDLKFNKKKISINESNNIKNYEKINNNKIKNIMKSIKNNNLNKISENLYNDFEPVIIKKYPIIEKIKNNLIKERALNVLMSGSGSSVFGIFKNKNEAEKAYKKLKNKYKLVYLTKTI